ncbi:MarR family winged helix-turn-helix transcriptional regulator [Paraburkholderia rhynchosiae]|uniref:MarR family transcriptional regulator n=1 Tax=Paraburkholderia rhynchosiae TaxID=487049 RepID=A0A2N7W513_9BURK|nr:MarR family transcriptional regulator [Paraburkholderia rhynchosiae]PMS24491.1 MarR family transcriptional regulator [Paraburkholderia rhynchosiae]CAB3736113.1 Transcriptional regulator SlyA [Paraburkholderia rhynchosiae]
MNQKAELPTRKKKVSTPTSNGAPQTHEEGWDQRLGFLMHDVSRLRRTAYDGYMKPLKITRSQWWVLIYLARHDGMIQSDLAKLLELGKAALGGLIDRLEASGLVRRGADETDRRAKRIYLSAAGTKLIRDMQVRSDEMNERILQGLSAEERENLTDLLTRVKRNLQAIVRDNE